MSKFVWWSKLGPYKKGFSFRWWVIDIREKNFLVFLSFIFTLHLVYIYLDLVFPKDSIAIQSNQLLIKNG